MWVSVSNLEINKVDLNFIYLFIFNDIWQSDQIVKKAMLKIAAGISSGLSITMENNCQVNHTAL